MMKIPPQVNTVFEMLEAAGFEAFLVGGAVRDYVRGDLPAKDWDITTNALPEQVEQVFAGFYLIETGLKHGTVTIVIDHEPLEITTYRMDGDYSDHRHPDSVSFTRNLKDDLDRRDFKFILACTTFDRVYHNAAGHTITSISYASGRKKTTRPPRSLLAAFAAGNHIRLPLMANDHTRPLSSISATLNFSFSFLKKSCVKYISSAQSAVSSFSAK